MNSIANRHDWAPLIAIASLFGLVSVVLGSIKLAQGAQAGFSWFAVMLPVIVFLGIVLFAMAVATVGVFLYIAQEEYKKRNRR